MAHADNIKQYLADNGFTLGELFRIEGYRNDRNYLWWEVSPDWRVIDPVDGVVNEFVENLLLSGVEVVRYYRRTNEGFEPLTNRQ